ncbi:MULTISPECIES: fused response regulator/phosphatase [Streptomyces]|uniref:Fused response regulator/phosphatase n=1 Tax=Streptomyces salyersiae TaxID=3075530 RepID=A0ABU2RD71_9ACTN|nr:fused response regulator/phosphatase [Streptomyces sp. DSM 41770]MDT0426420.1 fused response regulator/phosphatase [Streptomyces sp. DSM 41770]
MSTHLHQDSAAAKVLVLDDNDTNRYIVSSWLRRAGHTVVEAADGTEGLSLLASAPDGELPELAVVDVKLPDMSGFEVCEQIKADPRTASLPVIHVSATAIELADRTQGLHRGADAYLTEPIAPDELLATVTAALRYARARRRAERLATRVSALNSSTLAVYAAGDGETFIAAAAAGAATLMESAAVAVGLSPDNRTLHLAAVQEGEGAGSERTEGTEPSVTGVREDSRLLDLLTERALGERTGTETVILSGADWRDLTRREGGGRADVFPGRVALTLARTKRGRPAVAFAVAATALAGTDDRELLSQLAQACALALEALRTRSEEHALVLTLQRTFLPDRLPAVPGVDMAVRYEPAADHAEIGGDFYEAIQTPAGLLLAIGDVAGHSLKAAMIMGEVRHALRAYAIEGHDPQSLLKNLDALLVRVRPSMTVTVCLVLVEPGVRRIQVANAGHIPPLLRHPDGSTRYLTEHGPLLGLNLPHPPVVSHDVPEGSTLLLLTDGLVEVPGEDLDESMEMLSGTLSRSRAELDELCDQLLATFGKGKTDDIALLAARFHRAHEGGAPPGTPPSCA